MSLTPEQQYQQDLLDPHFHSDPAQAKAIAALDGIHLELCQQARQNSLMRFFKKRKGVQGLYMWGSVGTGKSYLMNTFYNCLPFTQKVRLHFHEFMQQVHHQLKNLQGEKNPLDILARQWAEKTYVLCFDEFYVKDIADAMILGKLFTALFAQRVCIIATSNRPPQDLYKNGLQRQRFLPAIKVIEHNMNVVQVDNNIDYRLERIKPADVYFYPLNNQADKKMMQSFHYYAGNDAQADVELNINDRVIIAQRVSKQVAWFSFTDLCENALGSEDYLELSTQFTIIMLSDVPSFKGNANDAAVRFINLVDILYDRHNLFIMSAATSINNLYQDERWAFEFERTKSRLIEMNSQEYIDAIILKEGS